MGRPTACFKIITCGSDSAQRDKDDLDFSESKGTSDKRGWSFRKRSPRHRVLSNNVISETLSSGNKDSPQSANFSFQPAYTSTIEEKISAIQCTDEKPQLPLLVNAKGSETIAASNNGIEVEVKVEESVVILIQAVIRGILAQRELLKLKNVVKVQAAVRGHLVRRHAVGTLRCVQAIVKMQALVRARLSLGGSESMVDEKHPKDCNGLRTQEENLGKKPSVKYVSIEKLLRNQFARQLMESNANSKSKPIFIECDPAKANSGWNWMERWMSVASPAQTPTSNSEITTEQGETEKHGKYSSSLETRTSSEGFCERVDTAVPSETEENRFTYGVDNIKQACNPTQYVQDRLEHSLPDKTSTFDVEGSMANNNFLTDCTMESDAKFQSKLDSRHIKSEREIEQPKHSLRRDASEQLEPEGKKFVSGSRKGSNSAFVAVQSKFEELSSAANLDTSMSSSYKDVGVESSMDTILTGEDTVTRAKEKIVEENSVAHNSRVQYDGSECGTELSISSTLDSPERSEVGAAECENEAGVALEETCNLPSSISNLHVKANHTSLFLASNLSQLADNPEKVDDTKGEAPDLSVAAAQPLVEQKKERSVSDIPEELNSGKGCQACVSSPEASPKSHMTVTESQGTPSSQVDVKAKRSRTDRSGSSQKSKSFLVGKRSPSNANPVSGARNGVEQLPKDQKNGKIRNSFGASDNFDQEPRDSSSSSNSIPRFMQATESARAKLNANNSPRSSPDVHDRDYIKKRHSLPGASGKQDSPRIQRSTSQAQAGAKGNERKWQR
ncbi:protein IQ-DOMAIN 32-like isoform X2 [Tripterygium wilfordii]|uniref:protein IQ-DOMAIN 32-like isoform X2 n=1 Tax=Tripterygium wilfordii TaxID=458696 RepID=UPI0018F852F2|nr:protein IQ-DOMAIN 32-like isoform X2 [Tripterygium wilfordii]